MIAFSRWPPAAILDFSKPSMLAMCQHADSRSPTPILTESEEKKTLPNNFWFGSGSARLKVLNQKKALSFPRFFSAD